MKNETNETRSTTMTTTSQNLLERIHPTPWEVIPDRVTSAAVVVDANGAEVARMANGGEVAGLVAAAVPMRKALGMIAIPEADGDSHGFVYACGPNERAAVRAALAAAGGGA